ncbi:MAG: hypothetical protein HY454_00190 [Parcubacteria group bacterium]|nr:hypothetical protein [Parcubacteria group bacterium]
MNKTLYWVAGVLVVLVVSLVGGYFIGFSFGYQQGDVAGYKRAETDIKKIELAAGEKAAADAAKAANPFQVVNPLQDVDANPFEKAKKVLNPFE